MDNQNGQPLTTNTSNVNKPRRTKRKTAFIIVAIICFVVLAANIIPRISNSHQLAVNGAITSENGSYSGDLSAGLITGIGEFTFSSGDQYIGEWTNAIINGIGEFTFKDQGTYNGSFAEDRRQGPGTYTWENGDKVEGEWINDVLEGEAIISYASGGTLSGYFENGNIIRGTYTANTANKSIKYSLDFAQNMHSVTCTTEDGTTLDGKVSDGQLASGSIKYPSGERYEGDFSNGVFQGTGTYFWTNGDTYTGEWQNGKIDGDGTLSLSSNGAQITGKFVDEKIDAVAYTLSTEEGAFTYYIEGGSYTPKIKIVFPNGITYVGTYDGQDLSGEGTFTYVGGSSYTGTVKLGQKSGDGVYTWPNGDRYVGKWSKDRMNGEGIYYFSSSNTHRLEGKFASNVPNGRCVYYTADGTAYNTTWSKGSMTKITKR